MAIKEAWASTRPRTLRASEVAAEIGINRTTLYRWLERGIFPQPTIRVGRTVRWSVAVVEKFVVDGVTGPLETSA